MACSITLPYLTGRVIDDVLSGGDRSALVPLVWAVVGDRAWCGRSSTSCGAGCRARSAWRVEFDLRARLFAHLQRMSLSYFDRMPVGQLMSRATSDLQTVRFFLGYGLIFIFMQAFTLIIVTGLLLWHELEPGPAGAAGRPGAAGGGLALQPALQPDPHRRAAAGRRGDARWPRRARSASG